MQAIINNNGKSTFNVEPAKTGFERVPLETSGSTDESVCFIGYGTCYTSTRI